MVETAVRSDAVAPIEAAAADAFAPQVSVVVPCRDSAETLARTLASLRRQTLRRWEAIVVDDGSADATLAIAEQQARTDPRIRVLRQSWGGVSRARNRGLAAARGDWLLFLDSDDWLAPGALRRLISAAVKHPDAGVIVGRTTVVLPSGARRPFPTCDLAEPFAALCSDGRIPIHSALVRRELVRAVGGFDPGLASHEDWDLWQRIARRGAAFVQIPARVAFYRSRRASLSRAVRQASADGLRVLLRGHAPDPRIPDPAAAYAQGGPADALGPRRLCFLLWSAAREVALGGDGLAILASGGAAGPVDLSPDDLGELLASGMADIEACQPAELGSQWPQFEPRLRTLLGRAGLDWINPRGVALTLATVQARLNAAADPGEQVALDARDPLSALDGQVPPTALQLRQGGRTLGAVAIPALGRMDRAVLAETVIRQAGRLPLAAALAAARPWASWAFWSAALRRLGRTGLPLGREPWARLRGEVRGALAAGLRAHLGARLLTRASAAAEPCEHRQVLEAITAEAAGRAAALPSLRSSRQAPPLLGRRGYWPARLPILMYHRVCAQGPAALARYRVTPEAFRAQVAHLRAAGFTGITARELARALAGAAPLPARPVLFTFDDGYLDFAAEAWPVLKAAGFPATLFVVPGKVGRTADWDGEAGAASPLLHWDQLARLADEGVEIESHGFAHQRMASLAAPEIYREVLDSAAAIAQVLGHPPTSFCYPFGSRDAVVERVVEECGHRLGFTTSHGLCPLTAPPLRLPRLEVSGHDDLEAFARKLDI